MTEQEYRQKIRRELLAMRTDAQTGFRDAAGFIVDYSDGKPDTLGEGTLHTAIAAVAIATGNFHQDAWEAAEANDRLAELLEALGTRGWGNGRWGPENLAKELECSTRTVFRDMETLSTAGIPVWFDKTTQAYCVQPGIRFSKLDPTNVDVCDTASPPVHDLLVQARRVL